MISGLDVAEAVFLRLDPDAQLERLGPRASGARRRRRCCAWRAPRGRCSTGRAHGAELPRPALRRRDRDRAGRAGDGAAGGDRDAARHAQDHARAARRWRSAPSPTAAAPTTAPASTTSSSSRRTTARWPAASARRCGAPRAARPDLPLAVEVRDAAEIDEALAAGAPRLLLDNMTPEQVAAAVAQVDGRAELEASGGVTPETVVVYSTIKGLHYVSMGALTHSAPSSRPLPPPRDPRHDPAPARQHPRHAGGGARAGPRARRRDPRAQLPAARDPGRRRLRR